MATLSLKKQAPQAEGSEALATPAPMPTAFEGEFTARDTKIPYLAICQKSGTMFDDNPSWLGKLVYDKFLVLGEPVDAVFFRVKKYFLEDIPYGSDEIARKFDTMEEVRAAGVDVKDAADLDLLISVPADSGEGEEIDGKFWAPARITVRSTAYRATVPILRKDYSTRLKGILQSGAYKIGVEKKTNGSNSWFAPKLSAAGSAPEAVTAYIDEKWV